MITRRGLLLRGLTGLLGLLAIVFKWSRGKWSESTDGNRIRFTSGKRTFIVWAGDDKPLNKAEIERARKMAREHFNT